MDTKTKRIEAAYEWVVIPEDLPRENLVMVVAKTPKTTVHPEDPKYPIRVFDPDQLHEAARSLAQRAVGLDHARYPIPGAFTVDANWNDKEQQIEALLFLPIPYIEKIREGLIKKVSVEFTWRNERRTESGWEFDGFVFNRVDLLSSLTPGDSDTSLKLVEGKRGLMEGIIEQDMISDSIEDNSLSFFKECHEAADIMMKTLGEPFAGYKDFAACVAANKDKGNPDAYCGAIKAKAEGKKGGKEAQIPEKPLNPMAQEPTPMSAIYSEPKLANKPDGNVTAVGQVGGEKGPLAADPDPSGNPHKNLDVPAVEGDALDKSTPIKGGEVVVTDEDKSKQRVEAVVNPPKTDPPKAAEPTKADPLKVDPVKADPLKAESTVDTIKQLKEAQDAKIAAETRVAALETEKKQLNEALGKLQKNVLEADKVKEKAVKEAVQSEKKKLIEKIEAVLPSGNIMTNMNRGGQMLARDVRKIVFEEKKE